MRDFVLPTELEARRPPKRRDGVRLLVGAASGISHHAFTDLPGLLRAGDLLVVNTSGTLPAAVLLDRMAVHFSGPLPDGAWLVELRLREGRSTRPYGGGCPGEWFPLPGGATLTLEGRHDPRQATGPPRLRPGHPPGGGSTDDRPGRLEDGTTGNAPGGPYGVRGRPAGRPATARPESRPCGGPAGHPRSRLWRARLDAPVVEYLQRYGRPIRYGHVEHDHPLSAYQTVFAREPGSAEMPSAGRPFTAELVTRLVSSGVLIAPLTLHTGVTPPELDEPPYPERYEVPAATASLVNHVRREGGRVIAVGTTVVRALETAWQSGSVRPSRGWTSHVITPDTGVRSVHGLLTGLHEPRSSHLWMLTAVAGAELLGRTYATALEHGYLWHEFGDLNLLLPAG